MTALSPRAEAIVAALSEGPQTMRDLTIACGYPPGDRAGSGYVSLMLNRLSRRHGYVFRNERRPGSHRGGLYVLMSRPHGEVASDRPRCSRCQTPLARDHHSDLYCSPCDRTLRAMELEWTAPLSLFDAMVTA